MATKDRTSLKNEFKNGNLATGERFADLIDSVKVVQLPVVDPQVLGSTSSFIDSISQDTDGKITATKKNVVLNYVNIQDKPQINGHTLNGDMSLKELGIINQIQLNDGTAIYPDQDGNVKLPVIPQTTNTITPGSAFVPTADAVDEALEEQNLLVPKANPYTATQKYNASANINDRAADVAPVTNEVKTLGYKVLNPAFGFAEQVENVVEDDTVIVDNSNTIFEIRDEFDLESGSVTIPANCTLKFNGGKVKNGTLVGTLTKIEYSATIFTNVSIDGTWNVPNIDSIMFSDIENNNLKNLFALQNANVQNSIIVRDGNYSVSIAADARGAYALRVVANTDCVINGTITLTPFTGAEGWAYGYFVIYCYGDNIHLHGSGTIVGDYDKDNPKITESGHGIRTGNNDVFTISGLTVKDCHGDCIAVSVGTKKSIIENVSCTNWRRNGLAIVDGTNIIVRNSSFVDGGTTSPTAGIDIEPNSSYTVEQIVVENCNFSGSPVGLQILSAADAAMVKNVELSSLIFSNHEKTIAINGQKRIKNVVAENILVADGKAQFAEGNFFDTAYYHVAFNGIDNLYISNLTADFSDIREVSADGNNVYSTFSFLGNNRVFITSSYLSANNGIGMIQGNPGMIITGSRLRCGLLFQSLNGFNIVRNTLVGKIQNATFRYCSISGNQFIFDAVADKSIIESGSRNIIQLSDSIGCNTIKDNVFRVDGEVTFTFVASAAMTTTPTVGAKYTSNKYSGIVFTVKEVNGSNIVTNPSDYIGLTSGSGTLTKTSGTGDTTIAYTSNSKAGAVASDKTMSAITIASTGKNNTIANNVIDGESMWIYASLGGIYDNGAENVIENNQYYRLAAGVYKMNARGVSSFVKSRRSNIGATANRPAFSAYTKLELKGQRFYDTDIKQEEIFNGDAWVNAQGYTPANSRGATANRPTNLTANDAGFTYWNTDTKHTDYWDGTAWVDATGEAVGLQVSDTSVLIANNPKTVSVYYGGSIAPTITVLNSDDSANTWLTATPDPFTGNTLTLTASANNTTVPRGAKVLVTLGDDLVIINVIQTQIVSNV